MTELRYSAALRSVSDNEFLRRTLASLALQSVPPREIVIAIPEEVEPWPVAEPAVRFVQAPRGMVSQRAAGIVSARNRLTLLLDDDIVLAPDAAERLLRPLAERQAQCVVPYWPEAWGGGPVARFLNALWGIAVPRKSGGIEYLAGGGFYYPLTEPPPEGWRTCGGAGAVIAVDREFALCCGATGDLALQAISPYALRDDGALILSWHQHGGNCLMIAGIAFQHLGGTTRLAPDRSYISYKSQIYNHLHFWRNYLKPDPACDPVGLAWAALSLGRYFLGIACYALLLSLRTGSLQPVRGFLDGLRCCLARRGGTA